MAYIYEVEPLLEDMFQTPSVPEVNQWAIRGISLRYKTLDKLEETGDVERC
jgi:hypothetical protein